MGTVEKCLSVSHRLYFWQLLHLAVSLNMYFGTNALGRILKKFLIILRKSCKIALVSL